ncbi:MAG: Na+/H+ antiporter NhaC family protein [Chlamydiota bacterium]|nr:Na+/H+ antiporter NhaC family protein [Chlamydiota bacterium]
MSWITLAPPLVVFTMGFLTKRICLSLFVGIAVAAAIASGFNPYETANLIVSGIWNNTAFNKVFSLETFAEASNFFIVTFVLSLGILIEMLRHSHAATAFVEYVESSIKSKKSAETSTLILAHCLSIDDYLSSLTVGSVMRPLTDRFKIPRIKLAFLTDSMAAPLAMITPVSSWAAAIIGFLTENGVHAIAQEDTLLVANPYSVYLSILPYIFYSISLVISVWVIVRFRLSFSIMKSHESIADSTGNLAGGKPLGDHETKPISSAKHHATITDFLVPICTLMGATVFYLLYFGDSTFFGGNHSILYTLQNAPISLVLFFSGLTALLVSMLYYLAKQTFTFKEMGLVCWHGLRLMLPVATILVFSWTMGDLLRENLKTGEWLASLLAGSVSVTFMPLILFWNATLISLALGSSWATTAILLPIALPMVMAMLGAQAPAEISQLPIVFPVFGAILSGAVCGDHISLISETTIMATTSAMCDHMDHVKSQLIYSLPVFLGCTVAFLISGFIPHADTWASLFACLGVSIIISISTLVALHCYGKCRKVKG